VPQFSPAAALPGLTIFRATPRPSAVGPASTQFVLCMGAAHPSIAARETAAWVALLQQAHRNAPWGHAEFRPQC